MSGNHQILAATGSDGLKIYQYDGKSLKLAAKDTSSVIRAMCFSQNGSYFAYCNGISLIIRNMKEKRVVAELPYKKISKIYFSPNENYLCTYEAFVTTNTSPEGQNNVRIFQMSDGTCVYEYCHKKINTWQPQWSFDENLFLRVQTSELWFSKGSDFDRISSRLVSKGIEAASLAPSSNPCYVAVYSAGLKGAPSNVRVYAYPNWQSPITNKSFYKADSVAFFWNNAASGVLVLTSSEVSKHSYYGEQTLHFLSVARPDETVLVTLPKAGPIYHVLWHPNSTEFIVTHGSMPAQTTVFNTKCEVIYHFGTGSRNVSYLNAQANIICLAGFGNLNGQIDIWNYDSKKMIGTLRCPDTTLLSWSDDGEHFLTATTSPRLRIDNKFRIWHVFGQLVCEQKAQPHEENECAEAELQNVLWAPIRPLPIGIDASTARFVETVSQANSSSQSTKSSAQAYVPPSCRSKTGSRIQTAKSNKAYNVLNEGYKAPSNAPDLTSASKNSTSNTSKKMMPPKKELSGAELVDKRIFNIKKKLEQIDTLKVKRDAGSKLEANQVSKIDTEKALRAELAQLSMKC